MWIDITAYIDKKDNLDWGSRYISYGDDKPSKMDSFPSFVETMQIIADMQAEYGSKATVKTGVLPKEELYYINLMVTVD